MARVKCGPTEVLGHDHIFNHYRKEIPKECYDECKERRYLTKEWEQKIFSEAQLLGYGVYSDTVSCADGKYYVTWLEGRSCD